MDGEEPGRGWTRFCEEKDELFAHHTQFALDEEQQRNFQGLRYFPYNSALCFVVEIDTDVEQVRQQVAMNADEAMTMTTVGRVHFSVDGEPATLSLYWLDIYGGGLFLPFRDLTCPNESYGGGRYLFDTIKGSDFLPVPGVAGGKERLIIGFHYAFNPSIAYNYCLVFPLAA